MKISKQQAVVIFSVIVALVLTFALGYFSGSNSSRKQHDNTSNLTDTDMDRAFGKIKTPEHQPDMQNATANSLGSLVAGLEKKVAANPGNIDQQILLAQTYNELDERAKSLKLLRALNQKAPQNAQVKISFATVLMKGVKKDELLEANKVFDEVIQLKPDAANMVRMYQQEIKTKLNAIK